MRTLKFLSYFMIFALTATTFVSCDDDDDSTPLEGETISLGTKDYTQWHYFSFKQNKVIGTGKADPTAADDAAWKARTDWDLAFHYKDIKTNSGKSGNGQGGMVEASSSDFEKVNQAPEDGYVVDDNLEIRLTPAMPPVKVTSTGSSICDGWAKYSHEEHAWVFANKVFIVKTADGKYAKIKLKSFLDDEDQSGTITMEYMYQPDGSTRLK